MGLVRLAVRPCINLFAKLVRQSNHPPPPCRRTLAWGLPGGRPRAAHVRQSQDFDGPRLGARYNQAELQPWTEVAHLLASEELEGTKIWTSPPATKARRHSGSKAHLFFCLASLAADSRDSRSALSRRRLSRDAFWSRSYSDNAFLLPCCPKTLWASRSAADCLLDCKVISDSFRSH